MAVLTLRPEDSASNKNDKIFLQKNSKNSPAPLETRLKFADKKNIGKKKKKNPPPPSKEEKKKKTHNNTVTKSQPTQLPNPIATFSHTVAMV